MCEPLEKEPFVFTRPGTTCAVAFNVYSLATYILATGDFADPTSRIPFGDDDLERLDAMAAARGLDLDSTAEARRAAAAAGRASGSVYSEAHNRLEMLTGLERCAGDLVARCIGIMDGCRSRWGDVDLDALQMELMMDIWPQLADIVAQMASLDAETACMTLRGFAGVLTGPPTRRNCNRFGIRDVCVAFVQHLVCQIEEAVARLSRRSASIDVSVGRATSASSASGDSDGDEDDDGDGDEDDEDIGEVVNAMSGAGAGAGAGSAHSASADGVSYAAASSRGVNVAIDVFEASSEAFRMMEVPRA